MTEVQAVRAALGNVLSLTCPVQEEPCECCVFERAVVAEGLAACDEYTEEKRRVDNAVGAVALAELHRTIDRLDLIASILRKAGLL